MRLEKIKIGDVVKFSKIHYESKPGYEYVKDWFGVVIECKLGKPVRDGTWEERHFCQAFDEIEIMWSHDKITHISNYNESWWDKLGYEPFEVISEAG